MIGKTILHYKILSKLGEGGMGVVYKAEDTKIKREVAIKFLPRQIAASDEERERFKIEAQAAGALNHSNIATIHAIEEADDETFIVMEHLKGQELKDKIDAGPLPIDDTLNIAIQIAKGLKAAHNKDIIHRDIKSANIMLTDEGDVKIMDFGLAKRDGQAKLTEEGTTHGTVAYMSPEQTQGDEVDRRSDIFSLGVLLYEMLTGQLPFKGDYYQAITYSVLNEEPEPVTGIRTGIPMEVERIVNKCLRKDAAFRYQGADELIVDLRVQQGESSTGSQPARPIGSIAEAPPAIAVLPFENRSPDEENEFLSDGIAEDIITALSKLGGLRVAARNAVFQFKGQTPDIRKVGGQLNVETVLAGSVRQAGNRLRIHVQLSNVADGYEIWSERYDRVMADVFDIQDEISQAVVETLKVKLIGAQKIPIFKHYTENAEAYSLYLRGRFYWNKRMPDTIAKAKKNYEDALAKDPEYALAHSGLADCYTALVLSNEVAPPSEVMSKAKMSALKALEIDANLAEAHASLAFVNVLYDWDWSGAERALERALNLNPDYASAYHWQAIFLFPGTGRLSEAEAAARRAQELDPISPSISIDLACVHLFMGQYEKVVQEASNALELDLKNPYAHFFLGRALVLQGSYDEGRQALKKAKLLTFQEGHIGYAHAVSGNRNAAQKSLAALNRKSRPIHITAYQQALIYCGLGDLDQAFQSLNLACENRSPQLVWTRFAPEFEPLHRDLRWEELLRKVGVFGTPESDLE